MFKYEYKSSSYLELSKNLTTVIKKLLILFCKPGVRLRPYLNIRRSLVKRLQRGRYGLDEFKKLAYYTSRLILGGKQPIRPLMKIPNWVWMLKRKSKSSTSYKLFSLSLMQMQRLVVLPAEIKLSTISGRFSGSLSSLFWEIKNLIESARAIRSCWDISQIKPFEIRFRTSMTSGPNRLPSLFSSIEDYVAIRRSGYKEFLKILGFVYFFEIVNLGELFAMVNQYEESIKSYKLDNKEFFTNRLAFLPDKAGKTRVVGIGNIFYQSLLKPLHDHMFSILRLLPQDGTHDHVGQAKRVKKFTSSKRMLYSIDMSACTDRFPAIMQALSLYFLGIFNLPQTVSWYVLLSTNVFFIKELQRTITYAVGQPMGYLSSWSSMAVSHHHLVYWANQRLPVESRFKPSRLKEFYSLIGDDIVISDEPLALSYLHILSILGISVNFEKSFSEIGLAEFAKGYFLLGDNLKPIAPDLLIMKNHDGVGKVVGLVSELSLRPFSFHLSQIERIFPSEPNLTTILQLICKDFWIFSTPLRGRDDQDIILGVTRLNLAVKSLTTEKIHELTSSWVLKSQQHFGIKNYLNPLIRVGQNNTGNFPALVFPCNEDKFFFSLEVLVGEGFISYDPHCWPEGILNLLTRSINSGISMRDIDIIMGKPERANPYRISKSFKKISKLSPEFTFPDFREVFAFPFNNPYYGAIVGPSDKPLIY